MKILFEVGHPAHVHLFKYTMDELQKRDHIIKICIREREGMVGNLLKTYGFKYENLEKNTPGLINKAIGMIKNDIRLLKIEKDFNPDLFISMSSPYSAQVSAFTNKPYIDFTDTEDAKLINVLAFPFASVILTPNCFKANVPLNKHVVYDGYHELAYLHPNWFKPDPSTLDDLNLTKDDKFIIVRFSSWDASHDIGQRGFKSMKERINFIKTLEKYGKVFITSEIPLPKSLEKNRLTIPPEKIHSLLWHATMYVGEGHTMATESAVLGTPSVIISPRIHSSGNYEDLKKYGLIEPFTTFSDSLPTIVEMLDDENIKNIWRERRESLLNDKIEVTSFMVDFIERYPESFEEYKRGEYKWPTK